MFVQQQNNIGYNIYLDLQMNQQNQTLPPFSLYNVGSECLKCCYQSQSLTVLCGIVGPYFERNRTINEPTFNCSISGSNLQEASICNLSKKLSEIASLTIVRQKYLRMNFDINFHIVEIKNSDQMMSSFVNLLCFTLIVSGVEVKSVFSFAQAWLYDEKLFWRRPEGKIDLQKLKSMSMVLQSSQKSILYCKMQGQYAFVHYQRLANLLMDANQQIHNYVTKRIGQINEQYQTI